MWLTLTYLKLNLTGVAQHACSAIKSLEVAAHVSSSVKLALSEKGEKMYGKFNKFDNLNY